MDNVFQTINLLYSAASSSTYHDVLMGKKTELEMFSPVVMELAKKHNISVPVNEVLYLQLRTIEKRMLEKK